MHCVHLQSIVEQFVVVELLLLVVVLALGSGRHSERVVPAFGPAAHVALLVVLVLRLQPEVLVSIFVTNGTWRSEDGTCRLDGEMLLSVARVESLPQRVFAPHGDVISIFR